MSISEPDPIQPPVAVISPTPEPSKLNRNVFEKISAFVGMLFYLIALICLCLWIFRSIPGMPICALIAIAIGTTLIKKGKSKIVLDKDEYLIIKSNVSYKRNFFWKRL